MPNHFGEPDNIVLKNYNPLYPAMFEKEKEFLLNLLKGEIILIEHVDSTAIKNIKSKPIVDISVYINNFPLKSKWIRVLQKAGYTFWETNPSDVHQFFFKGMPRTHHLHIYPNGHEKLQDKIIFRNYLSRHPAMAKRYEQLKTELAGRFYDDREKYIEMKTDFVQLVLSKAKK